MPQESVSSLAGQPQHIPGLIPVPVGLNLQQVIGRVYCLPPIHRTPICTQAAGNPSVQDSAEIHDAGSRIEVAHRVVYHARTGTGNNVPILCCGVDTVIQHAPGREQPPLFQQGRGGFPAEFLRQLPAIASFQTVGAKNPLRILANLLLHLGQILL